MEIPETLFSPGSAEEGSIGVCWGCHFPVHEADDVKGLDDVKVPADTEPMPPIELAPSATSAARTAMIER
jgi:hypothetical protein